MQKGKKKGKMQKGKSRQENLSFIQISNGQNALNFRSRESFIFSRNSEKNPIQLLSEVQKFKLYKHFAERAITLSTFLNLNTQKQSMEES